MSRGLDGFKKPDASWSGSVKILQLGASLVSSNRFTMPPVDTRVIQVAVGDYNADGRADIAINGMDVSPNAASTNDLRILLAQPGGGFFDGTSILGSPVPSYQVSNLLTADLNKDGYSDLIIARSAGDTDTTDGVYGAQQLIYLSQGSGTYSAILSPTSLYAHNVMVDDINGDGRADAFFFATGTGSSVLMLNSERGLQFTNDGLPYLATHSEVVSSWQILETYSNGSMKKAKYWHQHNTAFNDVDRDGDRDMVMFFGSGAEEGFIYINDGSFSPNFNKDPRLTYDAKIPGILSTGSHFYGILNSDGSWAGIRSVNQGANYYETIQFDVNYDGYEDIIAVATSNNMDFTNINGNLTYAPGTDGVNHGTFYKVLLNDGRGLTDQTALRIQQPNVTTDTDYHYGHFTMFHSFDLNGDGALDFMSNSNYATLLGSPNYENEPQTIFMLNDGKGHFEQVTIKGLEFSSYDPLPIDGKLGFIANIPPTDHEWQTTGAPPRPYWDTYFFKTNVPWTHGDHGNNFVYGTPANDIVDGGDGTDTYLALGRSTEFDIRLYSEGISIQDLNGMTGTDTLKNVEKIRFYDKTVAFDIEGNSGKAYRLYQAALDRMPDDRGLADWINFMDHNGQLHAMAQMFIESQEFNVKYGALDHYNFVNQLYLNVLDRDGEASGVNAWVSALSGGALSRAQVLVGFSESDENKENVIGNIQNGISYIEWWLS